MPSIRFAAALAILATFVISTSAQRLAPITLATAEAIKAWFNAAKGHTPGQADASVLSVSAYTYETRELLNDGMPLFLAALTGKPYDTKRNRAMEEIAFLGHAAGKSFLKQAAVLHADVAAYTERYPSKSTAARQSRTPAQRELHPGGGLSSAMRLEQKDTVAPLLIENRLLLNKDGQVLGEVVSSWNWPFARSLLDLLNSRGAKERATDPFVSAWYHATTAYMFASGLYGDATPHLLHAAEILPDDAPTLFDRGCYAELLGLPMHQTLLPESPIAPRDADLRIPPAERTNADAERLLRRTLAIAPTLVEARVRLARLLEQRNQHQEAARELNSALASSPSPVVAYYAHLFAGRTVQALGQIDEASRHYDAALALFPDAQSALLAVSQLALIRSDVAATLTPIEKLGPRSAVFTADPWWQYHLCSGRDADDLLRAMWAGVPR